MGTRPHRGSENVGRGRGCAGTEPRRRGYRDGGRGRFFELRRPVRLSLDTCINSSGTCLAGAMSDDSWTSGKLPSIHACTPTSAPRRGFDRRCLECAWVYPSLLTVFEWLFCETHT